MLQATPAHALSRSGVSWADLAAALTITGLDPLRPGSTKVDATHQQVLRNLLLPAAIFTYALLPDYMATFGFSPYQMDQGLQIGDPPNTITLVRGPWNAGDLTRAWKASKYQEKTTESGTVWSWADGPTLDRQDPVSAFGQGNMNNAAILPDGMMVFAASIALVTLVLRTAAGGRHHWRGTRGSRVW